MVGWGSGEESWVIHRETLFGDPATPDYAAHARRIAAATGDARQARVANLLSSGTSIDPGENDTRRVRLEQAYREWHDRDELFAGRQVRGYILSGGPASLADPDSLAQGLTAGKSRAPAAALTSASVVNRARV